MSSAQTTASESIVEAQQDCVVLLHGMGRTRWSMRILENALKSQYQTYNQSYPSRKHSIENLARLAIGPALEACKSATRIHFVTHSLGGILVRQYLSENRIDALGHVVMLGPPNQGSEIVDAFQSRAVTNKIFEVINGPAGQALGTGDSSKPISLGPVDFSLGVIAGNINRNPIFKRIMPSPSDGKVTVESTKVEGMTDHLELDVDHTWMMNNQLVVNQIKHFLQYGSFDQ